MIQIEITTQCNLTCFYCTGRHMEQKQMDMDVFKDIVTDLLPGTLVHLQGEGEPLLHPRFGEMVDLCTRLRLNISTTTNGTIPFDINKVNNFHVSLDTLDPEVAETIGRHHLDKTLRNLETWIKQDRRKLCIRITDHGQELRSVYAYCNARNLRYEVQKLNNKEEYGVCYPVKVVEEQKTRKPSCHFVRTGFKYYTVDGHRLPCCFIKFPKQTLGEILADFQEGNVPSSCRGCPMLRYY